MSGTKRPISPRIPPNVNLPPLAETIQQQVAPPAPQPAAAEPQAPQTQAVVAPVPAPAPQEEQQVPPITDEEQEATYDIPENADEADEHGTYVKVGGAKTGTLEFDLISHRQKGKEKRYLNVIVTGLLSGKEKKEVGECRMNIINKEEFEGLKEFFANLNWED